MTDSTWLDRVERLDGPLLVVAGRLLNLSASAIQARRFLLARLLGKVGGAFLAVDRRLHSWGFGS